MFTSFHAAAGSMIDGESESDIAAESAVEEGVVVMGGGLGWCQMALTVKVGGLLQQLNSRHSLNCAVALFGNGQNPRV